MIDDQLRRGTGRQRVVPHLRLGVDQADEIELGGFHPSDRLDGQVQHLEQGLVLGPPDDPAIGRLGVDVGAVLEEEGEAAGARHRVRVGVVVREHERPLVRPGDGQELPEPEAQLVVGCRRLEPLGLRRVWGHEGAHLTGVGWPAQRAPAWRSEPP